MAQKPSINPSRRSITSNNYNPTGRSTDINPARLAEELSYHENKPNFIRQQVVKTELNVSPPASSVVSQLANLFGFGDDGENGALLYHYSEETNGFEPPPESYANSPNREFFEKAFTTVTYVNESNMISGLKPNDIVVGQYSKNDSFDDFIPLNILGTIAEAIESTVGALQAFSEGVPLAASGTISDNQNCSASMGGDFAYFAEPCNALLTSTFGVRTHPIRHVLQFHAGIDLAKAINTPIYAVYDGTIVEENGALLESERRLGSDVLNGTQSLAMGKVLISHNIINVQRDKKIRVIKDGKGSDMELKPGTYSTLYLHLTKIVVKGGQTVKTGDLIGYMGGGENPYVIGSGKTNGTVLSTGPHLHFELHHPEGGVLDPYSVTGWGKNTVGGQRCTTPEIEAQKATQLDEQTKSELELLNLSRGTSLDYLNNYTTPSSTTEITTSNNESIMFSNTSG